MKHLALVPLAILSLSACGSSEPAATTTPAAASAPGPTAAAAPEHAGEHGDSPPAMVAFHDVLAPLWHDETPERQAKTCAQLDALDARVAPLTTVEVAADKKEAWATAVAQLDASVDGLKAACAGGDFVASFAKVHDGFHALLEIVEHS